MKNIFTLLFFAAAMAFAASADTIDDGMVQKCIDVTLGKEVPTKLMAANLDVNHDGVINVADVTLIIQSRSSQEGVQAKAPAQRIDVEKLIKETLETTTNEPNLSDVNDAIDHNLKLE